LKFKNQTESLILKKGTLTTRNVKKNTPTRKGGGISIGI